MCNCSNRNVNCFRVEWCTIQLMGFFFRTAERIHKYSSDYKALTTFMSGRSLKVLKAEKSSHTYYIVVGT